MNLHSYCLKDKGEKDVDDSIISKIGRVVERRRFPKTGFSYFPDRAIKSLLIMLGMNNMGSDYPLSPMDEKSNFKEKYQDGKNKDIVYTVYKNVGEKKNEPFEKGTSSTQCTICTMLLIILNSESKCCCLYCVKAIFIKDKLEYTTFTCCDFDAFAKSIQPSSKSRFLDSGFAVAMVAEVGILKLGTSQKCLHNPGGCLELKNGETYEKVLMVHLEYAKAVSKGKDRVLLGEQERFIFKTGQRISLLKQRPSQKFVYNPDEDRQKTPM